mgnify:CR=1 FL=1
MDELMKHVELLKYPKDKVQKYKDQMTEQYQQIATSLNMEFADFLEQYMGMDEDTFKEELDSQIKEYVKQQEVLDLDREGRKDHCFREWRSASGWMRTHRRSR